MRFNEAQWNVSTGRFPQGHLPPPYSSQQPASASNDGAADANGRVVVFRFETSIGNRVQLVGDFTNWEKYPLEMYPIGGGVWQVAVTLPAGRYAYRFLVDGEWRDDPWSLHRETNAFGAFNAVVHVL
jgi:1,4-alpha-glucan branching enzyme